jgi:putative cardiolipin synthase
LRKLRWSDLIILPVLFWGASFALADRVAILDSAFEALEGRVHILESANHSIDVLYFSIHDDEVTRKTLELLREKALQGIQVRIVTNSRGFKVDPAIKYHLQSLDNFEIRLFDKPVAGRFKSLRQLHDKLMLVDGDRYIAGGRNLGAAYFDLHHKKKKNKKDRDIYVIGSSAVKARQYFDNLWNSTEVSPATFAPYTEATMAPDYCETSVAAAGSSRNLRCREKLRDRQRQVNAVVQEMEDLLAAAQTTDVYQEAVQKMSPNFREIEDRYVTFVHDAVEEEKVQTSIELKKLLRRADDYVLAQTPYLVPTREFIEIIETKQKEGVRLEVLTNSVKSTINVLATAGTERYKKKLIDRGLVFIESTGNQMLHAKSAVYRSNASDDGGPPCWAAIGSFNADPRSAKLNTETVVIVRDCGFADELEQTIRSYIEPSVRIASREDLKASKALKKEISASKRFSLCLFKLLTPLYRSQL